MSADEIRAALAAATPGPWDESSSEATMNNRSAYRFGPRSAPAVFLAYQMRREDAHLIANAPTYIADLLAEVDRLAARADAAVQVMNEHNCGKAAEAAYRRAVVAAVLKPIRDLADINGSIWLSKDTHVVRVEHRRRDGVRVTESMIRVSELAQLLDQIEDLAGGER